MNPPFLISLFAFTCLVVVLMLLTGCERPVSQQWAQWNIVRFHDPENKVTCWAHRYHGGISCWPDQAIQDWNGIEP